MAVLNFQRGGYYNTRSARVVSRGECYTSVRKQAPAFCHVSCLLYSKYFLQGFSNPPRATAAGRRSHRYACNPPVLHRPSKQQQLLRANQKSMLPHIVYSLHRSGPMDLCHTVTTRVLVVVSEKDAAKKRRRRLCPAGSMGDCPCEMDHHSSGGVGGVVGLMAYRLKRRGLEGRHEVTLK